MVLKASLNEFNLVYSMNPTDNSRRFILDTIERGIKINTKYQNVIYLIGSDYIPPVDLDFGHIHFIFDGKSLLEAGIELFDYSNPVKSSQDFKDFVKNNNILSKEKDKSLSRKEKNQIVTYSEIPSNLIKYLCITDPINKAHLDRTEGIMIQSAYETIRNLVASHHFTENVWANNFSATIVQAKYFGCTHSFDELSSKNMQEIEQNKIFK